MGSAPRLTDRTLARYYREIVHSKPLSRQEETELARRSRKGDTRARNELVAANLRFAISVAWEYRKCAVPLPDLIGAGNLGLIKAAERFDETRGFRFISYAVWWIRQAIQEYLANDARLIRMPTNRVDLMMKISRASDKFRQRRETDPEAEDLAQELDVPLHMVRDTLGLAWGVQSLDKPIDEDEALTSLDVLADSTHEPPDVAADRIIVREHVDTVLNALPKRERNILRLYFGLDGHALTLDQIGRRYRITRERVRQLKEQALGRIRRSLNRPLLNELRKNRG